MDKLPHPTHQPIANVRIRQIFQKVRVPCASLLEQEPLYSGDFSLKSSKAIFSSMRQLKVHKPIFSKGSASISLSRLQTKRTEMSQSKERPLHNLPITFPSTKYFGKLPTRRLKHRKKRPYLDPDDSLQITRIETECLHRVIKRPSSHQTLAIVDHSAFPAMQRPKPRTKAGLDEGIPRKSTVQQGWSFMQEDL